MPLPKTKYFTETMQTLNVKSYDDVLLYSQVPPMYAEQFSNSEDEHDSRNLVNLMGIFRAQYLLEAFGHRGNIYILTDYSKEKWVELGGEVYEDPNYD